MKFIITVLMIHFMAELVMSGIKSGKENRKK